MRLANEICAAAMEHVRAELAAGHEGERGGRALAGVRPRRGHRLARARSSSRSASRSSGRAPGIRTFTATGDRPGAGRRADAVRDLGLRRRLLVRPHEAPLPGRAARRLPRARGRAARGLRPRDRPLPPGREPRRARPCSIRDGLAEAGYPGQPSHPICHGVGARAHEPPYAHQAGGGEIAERMVLAIEPGCYWEGGGGLRVEDNFLITADGAEKLSLVPGRGRRLDCMSDDLIWTGSLNDPYRLGGRVGLYDTTLRDGEQTVGVVLDPEQKLEIARLLDELGIDRIEAGFPRVSDDDRRAVELISAAGLRAEIWGFSRAVPADLEVLVELGVRFSVIESPISDLKLDAIGVSRDSMLERITKAMRFAAEQRHPRRVLRRRLDARRARLLPPRLRERGRGRARRRSSVVDTLGIASPEAVADLVGMTVELVGPDVPVHFHGHNDFGVATASAVAAVRAGAAYVQGTINGMGERAGNANLGEVALTLRALYGVETNLRLDLIRSVSARVRELSGYELEPWKPVTGETLYRRESGAVASQFHDPPSIEPYSSELVGGRARDRARQEERARLDPDQGRRARPRRPRGALRRAARRRQGARHARSAGSSTTPSSSRSSTRAPLDRARLRGRRRRDRQPLRRPPRPGRGGLGARRAARSTRAR